MLSLVYNITTTMSSVFVMLFKQVNNQIMFICEVLMNNKIIGQRINEALAFRNVKQKELAKKVGVKDNVVSYWCSGTRIPNVQQIIQISKILNVSADYLLGSSEAKTSNIELKAICDYTGLTEEAVNKLHELCTPKEYNNILNNEDYSEENKKVISDFLISNEFEYIVISASNLLDIDKIAFTYIDLFFMGLGNIDISKCKEDGFLQQQIRFITNKNEKNNETLQDKCDLTLFKIQSAIISYFKKTTKILNQIENNNLTFTFDLLRSLVLYYLTGKQIDDFNFEFFKDFITKSYNIENRKDDFEKLKEIYERYKDE